MNNVGNQYYERVFSYDWGLGTASADLFDRTDEGTAYATFEPDNYRIISSDLINLNMREPDWLDFSGRWGQYERLSDDVYWGLINVYDYKEIGMGPSGPAMKRSWVDGDFKELW